MPDFMCQYGNCHETDTPITVSVKGDFAERVRFCSFVHLALWAKMRAKQRRDYEHNKVSVADQEELGLIHVRGEGQ